MKICWRLFSTGLPEYPAVPAVTIEKDEAVGLSGLSQAQLTRLELDPKKGALRARIAGIADRATSKSGGFARDHRLTIADTFVYSQRWRLVAIVAAWLISVLGFKAFSSPNDDSNADQIPDPILSLPVPRSPAARTVPRGRLRHPRFLLHLT